MEKELAESIQKLIDSGKGDIRRLNVILEAIKNGKPLFSFDQKYLDSLLDSTSSISRDPLTSNSNDDKKENDSLSILKNRLAKGELTLKEFDILKDKIKGNNSSETRKNPRNKTMAILLSLVGIVGPFGIGQIYLGKKARGIGIMITGFLAWFNTIFIFYLSELAGTVGLIIVFLLYVWQIFDAKSIYETTYENKTPSRSNSILLRTGTAFCVLAGVFGVMLFASALLNLDNLDTLRYELARSNVITNPLTDNALQTESWKNCVKQYGVAQCGNPPPDPFSGAQVDCSTNPNAYECNPSRWP